MIESEIIPYYSVNPVGERVLVIAPHPDDETFGCGGTIRILLEMGRYVRVIFLTSGDKGDPENKLSKRIIIDNSKAHITEYAIMREKEAEKALGFLGIKEYEFLRYPDREIEKYKDKIYCEIFERIKRFKIDTIYSPSPVELNPDHRTTARICLNIMNNANINSHEFIRLKILFYEVTVPLRPNVLVEITKVMDIKESAIKNYKSQLKVNDYLGHIIALNKVRALTVGDSKYVEAFWCVDKHVDKMEMVNWLSYQSKL